MFGKVIQILSWRKGKTAEESANRVEASSGVMEAPPSSSPQTGVPTLGAMNVQAFEHMLTRVEKAKKAVEIREHHAGINRNRVKRLVRAFGLVAAGALLLTFFSSGNIKEKPPIDKISVAAIIPVAAALPSATKTGHIAVIKLTGTIDGSLHAAPTASNTPLYLETAFAAVEEDPNLAGVILEIDSPGGSATASEQSYRIVRAARERLMKRKVRVIAYTSLGAYSGGYYIAMGVGNGNFFADPGAAVANIGVIMSMLNTAGLGEMFGVTENIVKTGPLKSTGAQWEKLTPEQRAMVQESVDESFRLFLEAVSDGRHIDMATLVGESQLPVGRTNGAWFSARRALEKKLIDGVIPVEHLYVLTANMLPDRERFNMVEFVEYHARLSLLENLTKKTGRMSGIFLRSMFFETTHRDAPMRSERE